MPPPSAALGDVAGPTINPRRGAVVATALAGTVLLVVGYGSGIGLVPSGSGGQAVAAPPVASSGTAAPPGLTLPPVAPPQVSVGTPGISTLAPPSLGLPTAGLGPPTVSPWLPDLPGGPNGPGTTGPTTPTIPPGSPPPSSTPTTAPPGSPRPPTTCTGLVDDLLGALTTYLGQDSIADLDMGLVRQVTAVLGLDRYLASGRPLTDQLTAPLTPVLGAVPAVTDLVSPTGLGLGLGSVLGLGGATAATDDAALLDGLRTLLGVDAGAALHTVATVTDVALRGLLDAVVEGC